MAKNIEPKDLKKSESSFEIIGVVRLYKNDGSFSMDETFSSGWTQRKASFSIHTVDGNSFNVQLMGGYNINDTDPTISANHREEKDANGKAVRLFIPWDERNDEHWLDEVSSFNLVNVGIVRDDKDHNIVKSFVSGYDAVEYLQEHLTDGMVVRCRGNIVWSEYDNVVRLQRNITSIYRVDYEEDKFCSTFRQGVLVNSDSIVKFDKENSVVEIMAYVIDYLSKVTIGSGDDKSTYKVGKNIAYLTKFLFDVPKNVDIKTTMSTLQKYLKPKKKGVFNEVIVNGYFVEGSVTQSATIDDLNDDIKELIEAGFMTEEDALGQLTVGTRQKERELHIKNPAIRLVKKEGEPDKAVVLWTPEKYNDVDIVTYSEIESQYIVDDDEEPDTVPFSEDSEDVEFDEDLMKIMGM